MNIKFKNKEHEAFYLETVRETGAEGDSYREALFYTLGILEDTRAHIRQIYDFEARCIMIDALYEGWQTDGSERVCRLAFNLYNGFCGKRCEGETGEEYTPDQLFDCGLLPYLLEAVRLRYRAYDSGRNTRGPERSA